MTLSTVPDVGDLVDVNPEADNPLPPFGGPMTVTRVERYGLAWAFWVNGEPLPLYACDQFLIERRAVPEAVRV